MEKERVPESISATGSTAIGKYHLFASLGRGGMADVYLAVARGPMGFNKLTVLKRLRADLASDPSFLNMLLDEARLAARLSHPNVVHTYEVGEERGMYFIAMEYLEGQALNRIINAANREKLELEHALCARIIGDALGGLHYAHELRDYDGKPLKIVHRDISPHNIFVTYDGVVKLMDFGIAKAASSSQHTEVGVLKGKVAYMSPEQAMAGEVDRRADIFSMGIVLWELCARQRLFSSGSAAATLHKLLSQPIPRLSEVVKDADPRLDAALAKALEKDPEKRFQTAQEFRNALEQYIAESGHIVRQEAIGKKVNELFEETREHVQKQIQMHMAEVSLASSTGELMALNLDALRRGASEPTPSGRNLLQLGSANTDPQSGSGSGVLPPTAGPESQMGQPQPAKKKGGFVIAALAAIAVLVVIAFVAFRPPKGAPVEPIAAAGTGPMPSITATAPAATAAETPTSTPAPTPPPTAVAVATATAAPTNEAPSTANRQHHHATPAPPPPKPAPTPTPAPAPSPSAPPADVGTGYLTLDTYPWTRVSENGRALGVTPLIHVAMPAGSHVLTLENPDQGIKQTYPVTVKSGETVSRRLGLK